MGALMVFLTAVRYDGIDAALWYHGADTEKYLGEFDRLHAPILMHLAEEDEFISKAAQAEIKAAVENEPNATVGIFELEGYQLISVPLGHTDTDHTTCLHVPSIDLAVCGDALYKYAPIWPITEEL